MNESQDRLAAALTDRYRIERELGRGGMATVYLAEDVKHKRMVAVKVLHPDPSAALGPERFLTEIRTTANLQHPHILPLHDSGQADGLLFYVMPYVEGQTLRAWLERHRQLPIEEALRITQEVASALEYAHRHGVIHRDIKPENILLSGEHALVADFGIALAVRAAGGERMTQAGLSLGTPAYMSPEQAASDPSTDGRSDIYSLGCVLYEMLAGQPPFTGASTAVVLTRHAVEPPPPLRPHRPTLPMGVEEAILKALAKAPADRFDSASDFGRALKASGVVTPPGSATQRKSPPPGSIAVLPFTNLSPDPENEYFSDGITEELSNALAKLPGLRVTARTSTFAFKGKTQDIREVGEKLQVATVLEGTVRRIGKRLRVTAELISVADGYQMWSERYDRNLEDVFEIQDEITRTIVAALRGKLGLKEPAAGEPVRGNFEAYDLYLRGRFYRNKVTADGLARAVDLHQQALTSDPGFAEAHAALAESLLLTSLGFGRQSGTDILVQARSEAEEALRHESSIPEAHAVRAAIAAFLDLDADTAEQEFAAALELNPSYANAYLWRAQVRTLLEQRYDDALADLARATELDPLRHEIKVWQGYVYYFRRDFERAIVEHRRTLLLDADFAFAHYALADALVHSGRCDEALQEFESASRLGFAEAMRLLPMLGYTYARMGDYERAREILGELEERARKGISINEPLAILHTSLSDFDSAFECLERSLVQPSCLRAWILASPEFDPLRVDPRYGTLLTRLGLANR